MKRVLGVTALVMMSVTFGACGAKEDAPPVPSEVEAEIAERIAPPGEVIAQGATAQASSGGARSAEEIYQAMLTGPQNMPRFSDRQLTPDEKKDIIAFIKNSDSAVSPGGYGLGGLGPVTEGVAMWLVGIVALIGATLWIGSRS